MMHNKCKTLHAGLAKKQLSCKNPAKLKLRPISSTPAGFGFSRFCKAACRFSLEADLIDRLLPFWGGFFWTWERHWGYRKTSSPGRVLNGEWGLMIRRKWLALEGEENGKKFFAQKNGTKNGTQVAFSASACQVRRAVSNTRR